MKIIGKIKNFAHFISVDYLDYHRFQVAYLDVNQLHISAKYDRRFNEIINLNLEVDYFNWDKNKLDSTDGKEFNTLYECLEKAYRIINGNENDNLINSMKEYIEKKSKGNYKQFLNLQNGNLFTIFSNLRSNNINEIDNDNNTVRTSVNM